MRYFSIVLVMLFIFSCKNEKKSSVEKLNLKNTVFDTITTSQKVKEKRRTISSLKTEYNFKTLFSTIKNIKHTGKKHHDMLTNSSRNFISDIFSLGIRDLNVKTTSYEYKNKVVFYVHTIKHINDTISIKPFLENAQGKKTEGYLGIRVLIFAMKNEKEVNFIDIPANWKHVELKKELLNILYKNIDSDVILCNRTKKCIYKDLRKNKIKGN